jgi:hypothetical protein
MIVAKTPEQLKEWQKHQKNHKGKKKLKEPFLESNQGNKGEVWVSYKVNDDMGFDQQQRYEWFCAGFLLYYDDIIRNAAVDHIMSFEWTADTVTIYLSNPVPLHRAVKGGKMKYPNWSERNPQLLAPSYGLMSDPPPPPPPPPPPMD